MTHAAAVLFSLLVAALPAAAQAPPAAEVLAAVGYSPAEIARIEGGHFVTGRIQASTERELVSAFAFFVAAPPDELVKEARQGLLDRLDPNTLAYALLPENPVKTGTVVVYSNRTSTDQVTGFGGSAKRSIGSKVLASQLEALYWKAAAAVKKAGG